MRFGWILPLILLVTSGCDVGLKQLGPTEYGVRFRKLPPVLGGGIANKVERPGETFVIWPWDEVYVIDTKIRNIEWGERGSGSDKNRADFVETRALDGNEVSLAVRVQYYVSRDPKKLVYIVQNIGTNNQAIEELVTASARADIRTHMNKLRTSEFFINEAKYRGESEVRVAMSERLEKHGIYIQSVNLKEHRFERVVPGGTIDRSYQERINQVQTLEQETEREKLRKATVVADKSREFNNTQANVNRRIEEAEGFKKQAQFRGDGYFESKGNVAKGIIAAGEAYVKGLQEQIRALSGPGGESILKLELAKSLLKSNPKFVLMGTGKGGSGQLDVRRVDTNDLMEQVGVFEALTKKSKANENLNKADQNK